MFNRPYRFLHAYSFPSTRTIVICVWETDGPVRRARTDVYLKLEKFCKKIERFFEKLVGPEGKAAEGRQSGRKVWFSCYFTVLWSLECSVSDTIEWSVSLSSRVLLSPHPHYCDMRLRDRWILPSRENRRLFEIRKVLQENWAIFRDFSLFWKFSFEQQVVCF